MVDDSLTATEWAILAEQTRLRYAYAKPYLDTDDPSRAEVREALKQLSHDEQRAYRQDMRERAAEARSLFDDEEWTRDAPTGFDYE